MSAENPEGLEPAFKNGVQNVSVPFTTGGIQGRCGVEGLPFGRVLSAFNESVYITHVQTHSSVPTARGGSPLEASAVKVTAPTPPSDHYCFRWVVFRCHGHVDRQSLRMRQQETPDGFTLTYNPKEKLSFSLA